MKLLSTQVHGILDYASVGALLLLPRALGWSKPVTTLLTGAALGTLAYSLLTRYELGAMKSLPMQTHLDLDALSGMTLAAAPLLFQKEDDSVKAALMGLGAFEIFASLVSDNKSTA